MDTKVEPSCQIDSLRKYSFSSSNFRGTERAHKENKPQKTCSAPPGRKLKTHTFMKRATYHSLTELKKNTNLEIVTADPDHNENEPLDSLSKCETKSRGHTKLDLLESLSDFIKLSSDESCKKVLKAIYESGKANDTFSDQDQIYIGSALNKTIKRLFVYLLNFGYNFEPAFGPLLLKFRSALQFILEDFKHFKTEDGSKLQKDLDEIQAKSDTICVLDEAISFWKQNITVGIDIEGYCSNDLLRPINIPASHTWWDDEGSD